VRDTVARQLEDARQRTLRLTDLDEPILLAQHDPLMSPLVWDLAHIGQQEELWLLRAGDPARPGMLAPDVDSLYDAFKHARTDRPALPLLPPVAAREYCYEVRGAVLDLLDRTPDDPEALFSAGMVVQHEQQHEETMLAGLQLRSGEPLPSGRTSTVTACSSRAAPSYSGSMRLTNPSHSTTSAQRTRSTSCRSGSAGCPSAMHSGPTSSRPAATTSRSGGPRAGGRTGSRST
jgi:hypothetical protein